MSPRNATSRIHDRTANPRQAAEEKAEAAQEEVLEEAQVTDAPSAEDESAPQALEDPRDRRRQEQADEHRHPGGRHPQGRRQAARVVAEDLQPVVHAQDGEDDGSRREGGHRRTPGSRQEPCDVEVEQRTHQEDQQGDGVQEQRLPPGQERERVLDQRREQRPQHERAGGEEGADREARARVRSEPQDATEQQARECTAERDEPEADALDGRLLDDRVQALPDRRGPTGLELEHVAPREDLDDGRDPADPQGDVRHGRCHAQRAA